MTEDQMSRRPKLIRNCRLSEAPDQPALLLMPEGVMRIKGTGVDVIKLCDGERSIGDILREMQKKFPQTAPQKIADDSIDFLEQLRAKRVMDF